MTKLNEIPVRFDQQEHTYTNIETGERYMGITGTLVRRVNPLKYSGIPDAVLQRAAERGTAIHEQLELIESLGVDPTTQEGMNYLLLKEEHHLKYLASEHTVSDMKRYATNIDVIYEVEENVVDIADYKTTYRVDHESASWQLSTCAMFLEMNNPHLKVRNLYVIWLRDANAEIFTEQRHGEDEVLALMEADENDEPFVTGHEIPEEAEKIISRLESLLLDQKELETEIDKLKQRLFEQMKESGETKYSTPTLTISRTKPGVRTSFDSKKFKEDNPSLYEQYVKKSDTGGSIRVTFKDN